MNSGSSDNASSRTNVTIIVAAFCGLLAVIAICVTLVMVLRPAPPFQPQASAAPQLADIQAHADRRERVIRVTRSSVSNVKRLEDAYDNGTAVAWTKLDDQDRLVVAMFHELTQGRTDSDEALCLASVYTHDAAWEIRDVLKPDQTSSIKDFFGPDSMCELAERGVKLFREVEPESEVDRSRLRRAQVLNKGGS